MVVAGSAGGAANGSTGRRRRIPARSTSAAKRLRRARPAASAAALQDAPLHSKNDVEEIQEEDVVYFNGDPESKPVKPSPSPLGDISQHPIEIPGE